MGDRPPASWTAATLAPDWCRPFTADEVTAIDEALKAFERASPELDLARLTPASFPLTAIDAALDAWRNDVRHQLVDGQGVVAFEGFPVGRYRTPQLRAIWWGLSLTIGTPVSQSHRGDVIGDVRDLGTGITGRTGRGYTSSSELNFHADAADVSGLFFIQTARHGGESRIASSLATHDTIAARRPDLLAELYRPLPWSWQGNEPPGSPRWYEMPVFDRNDDGEIACAYVRTNILLAPQNAGAPELTPAQQEAVQLVADVAAEPGMWVERRFGPGAMFFVNNHTVLHLRTAFVDWDEPERKRHLLRVWLSPPTSRALPASFAPFFGDVGPGRVRGGYPSRSTDPIFRTA